MTLLSACTWKIPLSQELSLPTRDPVPLNVTLQLTREWREAREERRPIPVIGDKFAVPLGAVLTLGAERVARAAFVPVEVSAEPCRSQECEATLTPRLVACEWTVPPWPGRPQRATVIIEWRLSDPEGEPVWIETVRGQAVGPGGTRARLGKAMSGAITDALQKSYDELYSAIEIRHYATRR